MSSALAIAGISYLLRDLLSDGVINSQLDTSISVTAVPPLRELQLTNGQSQLNVFLYHLTPNVAWRNAVLPGRDSAGARTANPPLALDLHYLITAYDARDIHAEALLGYAAQRLHEHPGFSRAEIRRSLQPTQPDDILPGLPTELRHLALTGLAEQVEAVRIIPRYLSTDEMFRIWTGLQAPYRPSLAYQVSAILIQSQAPAREALPVLRRGAADLGPVVQPSLWPALPTLLAAVPSDRQPAVPPGGTFKLFGRHLRGSELEVNLTHAQLADSTLTLAATSEADSPITVRAVDPDGLDQLEHPEIPAEADTCVVVNLSRAPSIPPAGWHAVTIRVRLPGDDQVRQTNALAIALAPRFAVPIDPPPSWTPLVEPAGTCTIALTCTPAVRPGQSALLLLGSHELRFSEELSASNGRPTFIGPLPSNGSYLARLRVAGVDSLFIDRTAEPPVFRDDQRITLP